MLASPRRIPTRDRQTATWPGRGEADRREAILSRRRRVVPVSSMGPRLVDRGELFAEKDGFRVLCASMGPRLVDRGEPAIPRARGVNTRASMGPRLVDRGETLTSIN